MSSRYLPCIFGAFALAALLGASPASASEAPGDVYRYRVFLDTDSNTGTGCDVTAHDDNFAGPVPGVEFIVTAIVDRFPTYATVKSVTLQECVAGVLGAPTEVNGGDWPVGLENGVNGADVVEFLVSRSAIGNPSAATVGFHATRAGEMDNDVLLTTNGQNAGDPIVLQLRGNGAAPALSLRALALSGVLLAVGGAWSLRRRRWSTLAVIPLYLTAAAMTAWALTIVPDGNLADWTGAPAAAVDVLEDSSADDPAEDIVTAFVTTDALNLYFRMDLVNIAPVVCGNGVLEVGEECEQTSQCGQTQVCVPCTCVEIDDG